jgi:hypothetical protein
MRLRHGAFEPSRRKGAQGGNAKGARPVDGKGKGAERLRTPQLRESVSEDEAGPPCTRPPGLVNGSALGLHDGAQLSGWVRPSFRKGAQDRTDEGQVPSGSDTRRERSFAIRDESRRVRTRLAECSRGRARSGGRSRSEDSGREKKGRRGGRWWVTTAAPTCGTRNPRRP